MLLDHIHQIEQQPQNELLEQLELTKLRRESFILSRIIYN